ncbi:hypothetical protein QLX08_007098 [Tetragonisca angustula]|uniref:Uncharacterized protein n=1 Tax=Tetragonisca angustula TaxID=166442 RepID=A0AAW0ZQZ7_9HYME
MLGGSPSQRGYPCTSVPQRLLVSSSPGSPMGDDQETLPRTIEPTATSMYPVMRELWADGHLYSAGSGTNEEETSGITASEFGLDRLRIIYCSSPSPPFTLSAP